MSGGGGQQLGIEIDRVTKRYGEVTAVEDIELTVREGEFVTLLGPSGCGKSTLLRLISGFIEPTSGDIRLMGQSVVGQPPYRRNTSMVFQDYALFPHRTVAQNLAFGLRMRKLAKSEIHERVEQMLELLGLVGFGERRIAEISGGQAQRVALGRALIVQPALLLLDEPLGALDLKLRKQMQSELKHIQRRLGVTFLYVTHDQEEALTMSDRIAVMRAGRVEQFATPEAVYRRPATAFVADFVGDANLLACKIQDRETNSVQSVASGEVFPAALDNGAECSAGELLTLVIRPENVELAPTSQSMRGLHATVDSVDFAGATVRVVSALRDGSRFVATLRQGAALPKPGDCVRLWWRPEDAIVIRLIDGSIARSRPSMLSPTAPSTNRSGDAAC
jgi:spermidine/putrescine ABC transporter ATP-binding subunit